MRRTFTSTPTFFHYFRFLLLSLGLLWLGLVVGQAQTLPASEGLVADSTEVRVLRQFYAATGGAQWTMRDNWLQGSTLAKAATWAGVGVSAGDVTSLSCFNNQLHGVLPASLGQLRGLQYLDLGANHLSGTLPASLGQLTQLRNLSLSGNQLTGALPPELGNLTQLQGFGADNNQLTGPLPASFGNWRQLGWLSMHDNQLTGPIPTSWGRLRALGGLLLQNNLLSGALPDSLGNCPALSYVWLSNNRFTGAFPASWGRLQQLSYLELSANQLSGPLPVELTQLAQLGTLNLSGNQLTGPLPDHWERMTGLVGLGLGNNQLTGQLPASFGQLPSLAYCTLPNNQLTGPLPAPAGKGWRRLLYLDLSSNQLSGPLPDSLGNCGALTYLNLSDNQLNGVLPTTLGQLTSLEQLLAPRNAFAGSLPASLGRLPRLWQVNLTDNQLTGPLPGAWGQLRSLRQLYLSHNKLQGPLPDSLGQLSDLGYLALNYNQLTGPLPAAWQGMRGLQQLHVEDNQLSGRLPEALPAVELFLDRNRFGGTVPASYATSPTLRTLSLNENELTQLPDFNASPNLAQLRLSISDNWLEFDSYERNQPTADAGRWYYWNYARTQRQPPAATTQVVNGGAAKLSGRLGGTYNHYQWQRQVSGQWLDMPGQTTPELSWAAVTAAESGVYRTRVVSDWVGGITLYSRPHVLDVLPYRALAQNRPDDGNQGLPIKLFVAADSAAWHSAAAPADMNYVRVWTPRVALTDSTRVPRSPIDSVSLSTQYLDGLGRPVQTVLKQASPQHRDLVQPQTYDGLGREPRAYLPYADQQNGTGGYRPQALRQQHDFYYPNLLPGPPTPDDPTLGVARTGRPYAETVFEASPLNRVTAQGAAGEAWQVTAGHVVERVERPNTVADSVLRFQPGYDPTSLDPGYQGFYKSGELWGTDVSDAHGPNEPGAPGYRAIEWKDKLGQVVLKQVEAARTGTTSTGLHSRWLRTCYVYDDFGRLRFVLQPEASKRVLALGDQAAPLPGSALPFLFHYRYDGRGRQIAKQVPGQDGETLVVYDQLDRPILSQDPVQRTHKEWSLTKYDALGRIILSGLLTQQDTISQVRLQPLASADTAASHQYEQRVAPSLPNFGGYSYDNSFPHIGQDGFVGGQALTLTYYDDYDFDNDGQPDVAYNASTDGRFPSGQAPVADALRTTGLTTRTKTRVLGVAEDDSNQAAWLITTTFYDERARPVQVQTTNARRGLDLLTTQLDFTGKVVQSVAVHQGPSHDPMQVAEFFTYDHTGRLLTTRQQLPGEARPTLLDSVLYNEIGQAVRKTLGTGRLRQEVDYAYNIRGWLTSLNDPYTPNPTKNDLFHLSLHYERGFTKGYEQYNGNLTGQTWRGRDGVQRVYGYVYDPLNRLRQGDFVARTTTAPLTPMAGTWKAEEDNYRLSFVSYDDNGNILTLRRRGLLQNATHSSGKQYGAVDNLTYAYQGNRLKAVDDQVSGNQLPRPKNYNGAPTSLAGDFQEAGVKLSEEYLYDANGNLTQDKNKGITGIVYNHLNLPRQIHFGQVGDSIVFRYAASGQKVAKLVYQTGKPTPQRTDYLGPYQYEQDSLKFFPHAEGRVLRFVSYDAAHQPTVRYQREFTFKDHLGNLRLAYRAGQTRIYLASLEQDDNTRQRETQQFDSLSVSLPIAVATSYAMGQYAARLNAGGAAPQPLGPLTQLTVQKGDSLQVSVSGRYSQKATNSSFAFSLASFVASLVQPAPAGSLVGVDGSRRGGLPLLQLGLGAGVAALPQLSGGVPKGYLRVLVFNQDSALIDQRTLHLTKDALGHYELLHDTLSIRRDGYVSVYVGNESAADVYFDELRIEHRQGLQVQENEYDPYGLDLAGVSGGAPSLRLKNFYQFNGKENQLDLGLNWNHQDWRFYDYQIGRWHALDPMLEDGQENWTPYAFGYDNAVRYSDPDGQFPPLLVAAGAGAAIGAVLGAGIEAGTQMYKNGGHVTDWHAVGGAALQGGVTGGLAGLTGGTSLLRSGAVGAVSNVAGGVARNMYDHKPITVGSVTKDAVIGAATGVGGALAARTVAKVIVNRTALALGRGTKGPAKVGVAYDRTTGEIFTDVSGTPHPELHPVLDGQAPNPSLETWPACNCAETKAVNKALNSGSKLENLTVTASKTNKKAALIGPCDNCLQTLKGVRFTTPPTPKTPKL